MIGRRRTRQTRSLYLSLEAGAQRLEGLVQSGRHATGRGGFTYCRVPQTTGAPRLRARPGSQRAQSTVARPGSWCSEIRDPGTPRLRARPGGYCSDIRELSLQWQTCHREGGALHIVVCHRPQGPETTGTAWKLLLRDQRAQSTVADLPQGGEVLLIKSMQSYGEIECLYRRFTVSLESRKSVTGSENISRSREVGSPVKTTLTNTDSCQETLAHKQTS